MRYVFANAHWNNRGDEAALCSLIDALRHLDKEAVISIIFKETKDIREFPYTDIKYATTKFRPTEEQVKKIIWGGDFLHADINMQTEMDLINNTDMVVYAPGGAVISDRFWWEKQLEYLFPVAYAQSRHIPTFFASPSIGPFYEQHDLRSDVLNKADLICLRESISLEAMGKVLSPERLHNVVLSNDLAFLGQIDHDTQDYILRKDTQLSGFFDAYKKIVAITITDLNWNVGYLKDSKLRLCIKETFMQFICYLKTEGIGVILIPQLFAEQDDKEYLLQFMQENCMLLSENYDSNFQQYLISKLYAVVGLRYHSNIFAAKMGIPMLPIVYEQKMKGFLADSEMSGWGIDVSDISFELIKEKFQRLTCTYENRKHHLRQMNAIWTEKSMRTIHALDKLRQEGINNGNQQQTKTK